MSLRSVPQAPWPTIDVGDSPPRVGARFNPQLLADMDTLVAAGLYQSRAAIVRDGVRRVLQTPGDPAVFGASLDVPGDRYQIRVTDAMLAGILALVEDGCFASKSAVLRDGIQRVLLDYDPVLDDERGQR